MKGDTSMIVTFGEHAGKSVGWLVLNNPDYAIRLFYDQDLSGPELLVRNEVVRLIKTFDSKPFIKKCANRPCALPVTRCSVALRAANVHFWCDSCNLYDMGAGAGKLRIISTYAETVDYVRELEYDKDFYRYFINILAVSKGFPDEDCIEEEQVSAFFAE